MELPCTEKLLCRKCNIWLSVDSLFDPLSFAHFRCGLLSISSVMSQSSRDPCLDYNLTGTSLMIISLNDSLLFHPVVILTELKEFKACTKLFPLTSILHMTNYIANVRLKYGCIVNDLHVT